MKHPVRIALVMAFACLSSLHPAPAAAGLVGYWSFDGCSTTDASGHGADLVGQGGPVCTTGRFGNAWSLNGTDQYLDRGFDAAFTPGSRAWSVAAWEKSSSSTGFTLMVEWYRCGANPSCGTPDAAVYMMALDGGHPYWLVRDDAGTDMTVVDTTLHLADGAWHFIVGTMSPATDSTKLYVDGALRGMLHGTIGTLSNGGVPIPLEVGRHFRTGWGVPDNYFPGTLDEVRIFDNELDAAAVGALYTNNSTTGVAQKGAENFSIEESWPNPTRGRIVVAFSLPAAEPASLSLFDIAGRRIATLPVGSLGAGPHRTELGEGRRLAPGVYMIRLTQGVRSSMRRVTVLN